MASRKPILRSLLFPVRALQIGDKVYAFLKNAGYVGYGTVTRLAVMVRDFFHPPTGKKLLDLPLQQPAIAEHKDDPALADWAVAVDWKRAFPRNQAKTFRGIFANPNIVCKLRRSETVDFLAREFGTEANKCVPNCGSYRNMCHP